jgi:hypothetical protein
MKYKSILEIKPFVKKEGQKYRIIQVSDIQYHSTVKRPTQNIGKIASKNQNTLTPYRAYTEAADWNIPREQQKAMIIEMLKNDPSYVEFIKNQEKLGYKVLLEIPDPIPLRFGNDTLEFLKSKKGKRIIRWFAKEKN